MMIIREASNSDLNQLQAIHDRVQIDVSKLGNTDYEAEVQKKGFLLGTDDAHDMSDEIKNAYKFLVAEDNGIILGYLIADHRIEQKFYDDEYKTWFDTDIKEFYYNDEHGMTIATVAVDPDSTKTGIATALLKHLETILIGDSFQYMFSIVVLAPITNCPSVIWHTKNGFKRLAMGRPRRLFDLDNFSSILVYKKLG